MRLNLKITGYLHVTLIANAFVILLLRPYITVIKKVTNRGFQARRSLVWLRIPDGKKVKN